MQMRCVDENDASQHFLGLSFFEMFFRTLRLGRETDASYIPINNLEKLND